MVLTVLLEILRNLRGELARRSEDQRTRHQRAAPAAGHDVDHRQDETGGLAGPGLRDPDDVLHHQDRRNRLALDVGRLCIAGFAYCLEQVFGKAEIGESHAVRNCPWNKGRLNRHASATSAARALRRKSRKSQEIAGARHSANRSRLPADGNRRRGISPRRATSNDRGLRTASRHRSVRHRSRDRNRAGCRPSPARQK